jgi:hypothetical protein
MNVFRILSIVVFLAALSSCSSADKYNEEDTDDARKIYRGEKIGFISEQMNFTESEAEKFWPIHKAYRSQMDSLWKEQKHFLIKNVKDGKADDATQAVDAFIKFEKDKGDYQQKYVDKLRMFLSDEQILKLFYTEYQFKHFMLNRMRGRHGHGEGRGKRMRRGGGNMDHSQSPCNSISNAFYDCSVR